MISRGITFNNIHSYHDLNLMLSKSEISPAVPKISLIDVPGADSSLDYTEVHGGIKYGNRNGTFTFTMNPMGELSDSAFEKKKTEVSNALNGVFCQIIQDKDDEFYYEGRCTVNNYLSDRRIRQIVVTATLKPYKMKRNKTIKTYTLSSDENEIVLKNSKKTVVPRIVCSNNAKVVFNDSTFNLNAGTYESLGIQLKEGVNILKVSGSGTIEFSYREGEL